MLGAGSWFIGIGLPVVFVGGFVASRKRLAFQWREELMDPDAGTYPAMTDADMEFFRRVAHPTSPGGQGEGLTIRENIGLFVIPDILSKEESEVLLDEAGRWVSVLGQKVDPRKVSFMEGLAKKEGINLGYYSENSIISDHAEDIQLMKAPWGTGDGIRLEKMPSSLRYVVSRIQKKFEGVGRLRHVYIEYSPSGKFYHEPGPTKAFDGHDYVIVPLRRDRDATVVTFSPLLRSKFSFMKDVLQCSWTSRDIDGIVPPGGAMRVYGRARYEWGWGIRPGDVWFGHWRNSLQRLKAKHATLSIGNIVTPVVNRAFHRHAVQSVGKKEAALMVLHFDGPRDAGVPRSLLLQPESLIFGRPPTPESYERWVERKPTKDDVKREGAFIFMVKNYLEMLNVS
uniref:Uncharacterized protein TCIL3000_9_5240 n=1 Tax=Trypanosoma congolense (strain IL3000) TaxID=1068625 RepID=G0UUQ3_TRYCI|nr:unnamed protein product [Trypanosoma congolense IL3000]